MNICAAFNGVSVTSFAISRGGDWVDRSTAAALGMPRNRIMAIKEEGVNLVKPTSREEEAIAIYYREFIRHFVSKMAQTLGSSKNAPHFSQPVDVVFAGGLTAAEGFLDMAVEELKAVDFGFSIRMVRRADDPFTSWARGCLLSAMHSFSRKST